MGYGPLNGKWLGRPMEKGFGVEAFWQRGFFGPCKIICTTPFPIGIATPFYIGIATPLHIGTTTPFPLIPFPMRGPNILLITLN